jgi:hypothetical protein
MFCLYNYIAAVASMLNLNTLTDNDKGMDEYSDAKVLQDNSVWKVLVFDKFGQDVVSSIMRVNDLRENGITVHM